MFFNENFCEECRAALCHEDRFCARCGCPVAFADPPSHSEAYRRRQPESSKCLQGRFGKSAYILTWGKKDAPLKLANSLEAAGYRTMMDDRSNKDWDRRVIEELLVENAPDWLICPQRLYTPYDMEVQRALARSKTRLLVLDYGLIDHYDVALFDPSGENAESSIAHGNFDRLSAIPVQAEAVRREMPRVVQWAEEMKKRAENCSPPDNLREAARRGMAVYFAQRTGDMVLHYDAPEHVQKPGDVAPKFVAMARNATLVPVVKPHPLDSEWRPDWNNWADAIVVSSQFDEDLLAWLIINAKAVVLVNSTLVFNCLALDAPVLQLGNGWCTGNRVVCEGELDKLMDLGALRQFERERRHRFLALLLSRQRRIKDLGRAEVVSELLSFFSDISVHAACPTCDGHVETGWRFCGYCGVRL